MRKMEMPLVDVIRFNESDVIVASGGVVGKTLSIRGVGDGQHNNAFLSIGGNEYTSRQVIDSAHGSTAFTEGYNTYMSGLTFYKSDTLLHRGQESLSIVNVLNNDAVASEADNYHLWANTTYTWNGGWYAQ